MRELNVNKCKPHKLSKWLRKEVAKSPWYKKSKRCYISGKRGELELHHDGMSFGKILEMAFKNLNIKYKGEYTQNYSTPELILLKNEVLKLHQLHAKPVTLAVDVHLELHRTYGKYVSHEQLLEFKAQYNKSEKVVA